MSLNPAAEIIFFSLGWLHAEHIVNGSSLIFCNASCWCPQASQRYSYIGMERFPTLNTVFNKIKSGALYISYPLWRASSTAVYAENTGNHGKKTKN